MPVYNIPIYGLLGSPENEEDKATYFQYTDLLIHINNARLFDTLNLDISSDGGFCDVADKMIDLIKGTGKIITSCNSGNVCSAASKIFTLAPKGQRFFHPEKGVFLIHNPWGTIEGDASELAQASKELKAIESEYAKWYAAATGSDESIIKAFMAENVPLTPDQVQQLGFAEIIQPEIKAVAKLKSNNNEMDNKEVIEKLNGFEKVLNRFVAMFKPKAVMIADATGKELEFPELTDPSEIAVGAKVNVGGSPAQGEFPQADGTVFVCAGGVLTEIRPAANEMDALKQELATANAKLAEAEAKAVAAEAKANVASQEAIKMAGEFKAFKAQFSDFNFKAAKPGEDDDSKKKKAIFSKEDVSKW
jgi:ATP-dependent protease ClpP protease subunit